MARAAGRAPGHQQLLQLCWVLRTRQRAPYEPNPAAPAGHGGRGGVAGGLRGSQPLPSMGASRGPAVEQLLGACAWRVTVSPYASVARGGSPASARPHGTRGWHLGGAGQTLLLAHPIAPLPWSSARSVGPLLRFCSLATVARRRSGPDWAGGSLGPGWGWGTLVRAAERLRALTVL